MQNHRFTAGIRRRVAVGAVGAGILALVGAAVPGTAFAAPRPAGTPAAPAASSTVPTTTATVAPAAGDPTGTGANVSSPECSTSIFTAAQQKVEGELADRVTQLEDLAGRVNGSTTVTSGDKSALTDQITGTELPGIQALQTAVQGDTTCAQLRTDAHSMVYDYRVYLVMTPETDLVLATDTAGAVETQMANLESTISAAITKAQSESKDVSGAQSAFSDFEAQVSASQGLTNGQSATLLALTPQGCPGNVSTLQGARSNLQTVRQDLQAARADLGTIRQDLS